MHLCLRYSTAFAKTIPLGLATILAGIIGGCASNHGPQVIRVSSEQYAHAFDAAMEAARRDGLTPLLKDRRSGVIDTDTHVAGSVLEPWRADNASFGQALENTLGHQRRRARFEFSRAGFAEAGAWATSDIQDLSQTNGDLELRVWVYVERANTLGVRRDTWTRRSTTTSILVNPDGQMQKGTFWTPVTRDEPYERRLLAAIEESLQQRAAEPVP